MIVFKKRKVTKDVRIVFRPVSGSVTLQDLERQARRSGKFNLGYHYILFKNGVVEKGIDEELYADYDLRHYETSIYVLAVGESLNDAQRYALKQLTDKLQLEVKEGD